MTLAAQSVQLEAFLARPNLEESPAWELMSGDVAQKPMPTFHHSILQKRLVAAVDGADSAYEAFPELRCILQHSSVVPDVTIIQRDRIPFNNAPLQGAPDWMIEILSPDQSTVKLIEKIQACLAEGTQLGWLVDPGEQAVIIFWPDRPFALLRSKSQLPVLENMGLRLTVESLFAGLRVD
jgi:Uma2 family endonuclease